MPEKAASPRLLDLIGVTLYGTCVGTTSKRVRLEQMQEEVPCVGEDSSWQEDKRVAVKILRKTGGSMQGKIVHLGQRAKGEMICIAVQNPISIMSVRRSVGEGLSLQAAPYSLYQVLESHFDQFVNKKTSLEGYLVKPLGQTETTQHGIVDLLPTHITSDHSLVLASAFPHKNGQPGEAWEIQTDILQDLPFRADAYSYPGENALFFGRVESGEVVPYGTLKVPDVLSLKKSQRVLLMPCKGDHATGLATVLCTKIVLDRGCDPEDTSKPGAWELVNPPAYVRQLCHSQQLVSLAKSLDTSEVSPFRSFERYKEPCPSSPKRPRSPPQAPPAAKRAKA
eukprot:TRINITY_DN11040_c0_g1_i2.p1 TRINITY_DN11040_c0_g1~~TRINITY_DN11040_c0_g1_i2.p1  ORF type:complete len:353 (+),score=39.13 TRINITY_DN11040_c0_g1_i2:46-1059(+)